jgi:signal peptidase I
MVEGNFALLLFLATLVTGLYWLAERLYFLPRRRRAADAGGARRARARPAGRPGHAQVDGDVARAKQRILRSPGGWIGPPACSR